MSDKQVMLSRVADSLYWMSRYLERAENTARLLDVYMNVMLDAPDAVEQLRLRRLQSSLSLPPGESTDADEVLQYLTFDEECAASIAANIVAARENARQVREEISSEMWTQINQLYLAVQHTTVDLVWSEAPHNYFVRVKEGSHLFQGVTDATMNHNQGWQFIQIGRYVERIMNLLQLLSVNLADAPLGSHTEIATDRYFELVSVLKSVSAFEAYCKVYSPSVQSRWIIEFLLFNRDFPRSLRFGVEMIEASLNTLADESGRSKNTRLYRMAGRLQSNLSYDEISDVDNLQDYLNHIRQQIIHIHNAIFDTFITYSIDMVL